MVTGLPAAQLEMILAHELAHIRRHDYLVNLLQTLVETLFFYHPAVWWLSRQIRNERENCCDDVAMATVGSRADYGRALLAIEELRATSPSLSLAASGGSLLARIRRIAGCEPAPRVVGGGSILGVIVVLIAILAVVTWGAAPAAEKPLANDPSGKTSAATLADEVSSASDQSAMKEGAKTGSKPIPAIQLKTINGVVVDEDAKPVADAQVWLPMRKGHEETTAHARTGKDGRFTLEASGDDNPFPTVWVLAAGNRLATSTAAEARWAEKGEPQVKIALGPRTDTTFLVLAPDGKPLTGALVEPFNLSNFYARDWDQPSQFMGVPAEVRQAVRKTTGADGRATLSGVPHNGWWSVRVTSKRYGNCVQFLNVAEPIPAETTIRLRPARRVEGRLVADDPKLAHGVAIVLTTHETRQRAGSLANYGRAEAASDDQGRFVVPAIAEGTLAVQVQIDEHVPYRPELPPGLTVGNSDAAGVEIRMVRTVRIECVVRVRETGKPLADARVQVQSEARGQTRFVTSDKEGIITAQVLPGTITLNPAVRLPNGSLQLSSWRVKTFTVPAGVEQFELPPLEVNVKPSPADVSALEKDSLCKNLFNLLMAWGIRQEINLTNEQLLKYAEIRKRSVRSAGSDPRERETRTEELNKALEEMLTPLQIARLQQIRLQMSGVNALFTPSDFPNAVNAALQLSDEQELQLGAVVAKSGEAQSRLNKELQAIWNDRGLSVEEGKTKGSPLTEELGRLRCRQLADAMAVLTPEQREKFEQMKGPKFAGLAAAPAPARRNPGARRVNWRMGLMEFKTVQKDLKLTGNQQAKLHDLVAKAGVVGELMSYVGPYERDQMQAELDKTAEGILSPEQTARINEICVQILGADALSDPAVVQALGVTEKQKEALKTITPRSKENSERRPMEKTRIAEAIAVLTPLQREQFEKMKGPKFDISGLRAERAQ